MKVMVGGRKSSGNHTPSNHGHPRTPQKDECLEGETAGALSYMLLGFRQEKSALTSSNFHGNKVNMTFSSIIYGRVRLQRNPKKKGIMVWFFYLDSPGEF